MSSMLYFDIADECQESSLHCERPENQNAHKLKLLLLFEKRKLRCTEVESGVVSVCIRGSGL